MDVEEILKFADNLVFAKTSKHLDNLQEAILRGTWQDQKYPKIAEELHRREGHVRDIASELWKILSEVLSCCASNLTVNFYTILVGRASCPSLYSI